MLGKNIFATCAGIIGVGAVIGIPAPVDTPASQVAELIAHIPAALAHESLS